MARRRNHTMKKGPWVVTYRIETNAGMTIFEAYRGAEAECKRIARWSAPPTTFEEHRITHFKTIIGPASEWDRFLEENC